MQLLVFEDRPEDQAIRAVIAFVLAELRAVQITAFSIVPDKAGALGEHLGIGVPFFHCSQVVQTIGNSSSFVTREEPSIAFPRICGHCESVDRSYMIRLELTSLPETPKVENIFGVTPPLKPIAVPVRGQ